MFCILIVGYVLLVLVLNWGKHTRVGLSGRETVAFFHPFCNDGGGGEKVLWTMIEALLTANNPPKKIVIYSLEPSIEAIITKTRNRFQIDLTPYTDRLSIMHISGRKLLQPQKYLTMLCHILLPMVYCLKCLWVYQPHIFYDTTGFAFNFFLVKLLLPTTHCAAYVHYPFISKDMVAKVKNRQADYNNDENISRSGWKSQIKLIYYWVILFLYKFVGFFVDKVQTNSSWTQAHMKDLWGRKKMSILYPPCSIDMFLDHKTELTQTRMNKIISLAQFRPEKNHFLQIRVMKRIVQKKREEGKEPPYLAMCGTVRNDDDRSLLENLKEEVKKEGLDKHVEFKVDLPYQGILKELREASIGIHTMEAEHFGISVVQMLASGSLVVAHNSAGPRFDIIKNPSYLAQSEDEYFDKILQILKLTSSERQKISSDFRTQIKQFSNKQFQANFIAQYEQ